MMPFRPRRIVVLKPCCIGDVIFATPLLMALRRAYPEARIDWAVGSMAISALRGHPAIDQLIDTGGRANPASRPFSLARLVGRLRGYDLVVVPDRSRLYSLATLLAGIPRRAGLDSAGRGFAYNVKAPIDPAEIRHEAEIYLDVGRALGLDVSECWANVPPTTEALSAADSILRESGLAGQSPILVHPGGGVNAGMTLVEKRWPPDRFAALADRAADALGAPVVMLGLESDRPALDAFRAALNHPLVDLSNRLSLAVTGALASRAALYIGNDNGVAHLAAASGGKVLMIFGPSDPRRYAPFVPPSRARFAWRPIDLPAGGVSAGAPLNFNWARDGIGLDEAWEQARALLKIADMP
jgi:ADP-heptose:LPS heptosyltransferase